MLSFTLSCMVLFLFSTGISPFASGPKDVPTNVLGLLRQARIDNSGVSVEKVSAEMAFCNTIYRVSNESSVMYAKIFSKLAQRRIKGEIGHLDRLVARHGLAPAVLASTPDGILLEECKGATLTEHIVHGDAAHECCREVAQALARMHTIKCTDQRCSLPINMLWHSCEAMLDMCNPNYDCSGWTIEHLWQEIKWNKSRLQGLAEIDVGHGDLKPSNVVLTASSGVQFIDLELAGRHYRAFDIAKFFRTRTRTPHTERNLRVFLEEYIVGIGDHDSPSIEALYDEVDLLMPMSWLEAAIFFACMACCDKSHAQHWTELAADRLDSYRKSIS